MKPGSTAVVAPILVLASGLSLCGCATRNASPPADFTADTALVPPPPAALAGDAAAALSLNTPVAVIVSRPGGRAVLDRDLPGLCERPEFPMFKALSLNALAGMSGGKLTSAKLALVQADLQRLPPGGR